MKRLGRRVDLEEVMSEACKPDWVRYPGMVSRHTREILIDFVFLAQAEELLKKQGIIGSESHAGQNLGTGEPGKAALSQILRQKIHFQPQFQMSYLSATLMSKKSL